MFTRRRDVIRAVGMITLITSARATATQSASQVSAIMARTSARCRERNSRCHEFNHETRIRSDVTTRFTDDDVDARRQYAGRCLNNDYLSDVTT